ncbi:MAG: carboxypeptidase-like regulatory domain-containing protein [Bacteroidales bacterium]|jgi:hypothetical protein|nr:carboxypeptidase-like regulatory domain-containing protein [Bacteroidales bacterium]MDD4215226.1 carboxypeptidase-like regulatory domain-containing protein [Bacteroidales bacterium]
MKKFMMTCIAFAMSLIMSNAFGFTENNPSKNIQKANVSGKVLDKQTGESLAGVLVMIEESGLKVYTDLDGNFLFQNVDPGTYTFKVSYISYSVNELKNVVCNPGNDVHLKIEIRPN